MLQIIDLKVKFNNVSVLRGINLELNKGEVLAVVGESGAGKTTLGLSIMGLCHGQSQGQILYNGTDLLSLEEKEKRKIRWQEISIVFQDVTGALNPVMTVFDQVLEPVIVHGKYKNAKAREYVEELLNEVGLKREAHTRYPHQLSGGEKQRVLIAMALANDPKIIILDEPTSSMDALTKLDILKLLKKVLKGRSAIVVTHDISTALKLSQNMAVLYQGKIVELGDTQEIVRNPQHPYTKGLLRAYPNMTTTKDLQGVPGKKTHVVQGCSFHPRCTQKFAECLISEPELLQREDRKIACHRGGIMSILKVENLQKSYGDMKALKGVSFNLNEGDTLAVVGECGSGKTTLARCIMGLENYDEGNIYFQENKLKKYDKEFYKNVQMIFQNPQECVSHRLNVLEAVMEPLNIQGKGTYSERVEKVKKVLEEVELPVNEGFLNNYAHHLSGGEIQRLAIARALILEPKLLIADECTSALDASVQAKIIRLLLNLQEQRGLTMLFITHDLALARKVSDMVAVMFAGEIVEFGLTSEVFAKPKHQYTQDLINAAPDLTGHIAAVGY